MFNISSSPNGSLQGATVGNFQIIQCIINTVSGVTPDSVIVRWIGPRGISIINNNRTVISPLESNSASNFTSSLEFMYIMEGDEGKYMCNVSILQRSTSITVELGALIGKHKTVVTSIDFMPCCSSHP